MRRPSFGSLTLVRKCVIVSFLILAVGGLALDGYLDHYFCRTRPPNAEPSQWRIVRRVVCHGTVVYLTSKESFAYDVVLPVVSVLSFAAAALYFMRFSSSQE